MHVLLALVAAFIAFTAAGLVLRMAGLFGLMGFVLQWVAAIAVFFLVKGSGIGSGPSASKLPAGFSTDFHHSNIAIDTKSNRVWLRDRKSGQAATFDKGNLLRWTHRYTTGNHGTWVKNFIDVEVRDLNHPKYEVAFNRHSELSIFGARKNQAECEEWQSRLTTWINNT